MNLEQRKNLLMGAAAGVGALLALGAAAGLITVYSGAYNVAATQEHLSFTRWALDTTFHRSVEGHAEGVAPPEQITSAMIEAGAAHYKETCETCHGGPGAQRAQWASGMRPRPPHLAKAAARWELREIYWLAKHGARMTGMPAFGPTHDDSTLWSIAAFAKELPAMTPERYRQLGARRGEGGKPQGH